jgi:mannose-6-phosphate isomerase-like protein (cupin superfamily)
MTNVVGGVGTCVMRHLVEKEELPQNAFQLAELVMEPGASVGYHQHVGEGELYYITSGEGDYTEDGVTTKMTAGMASYVYDGHYHGIVNTGKEPLVMMAIVIKG